MTTKSRHAASGEQRVADIAKGERVKYRPRYVSAPDVLPLWLADGSVVQLEVKSTKRPPKRVIAVIQQAAKYAPGAIPIGVFVPFGAQPIACLALDDLVRLVGIREPRAGEQLALLGGRR